MKKQRAIQLVFAAVAMVLLICAGKTMIVDAGRKPITTIPRQPEGVFPTKHKSHSVKVLAGGTDVDVSNLSGNESEVSIAVNPTNPSNRVIVGHSPDFLTMNTFYTLDGGTTWTLVAIGDAEDGRTSTFRFDPTLAFDANGNLYVAYGVTEIDSPALGTTQTTIMVAKSTDGGQSYGHFTFTGSAPDNPAGTAGLPGSDKWLITTGRDMSNASQQNVYLTFTGNFDQGVLDQRILTLFSWDGGVTFPSAIIVNDGPLDTPPVFDTGNIGAAPAVGPDGELYVCWLNAITKKISIDVSTDGGLSFGTDLDVATTSLGFMDKIPAQPDRGIAPLPVIDVDRSGGAYHGTVYIAYCDIGTGGLPDTDIFVKASVDQGITWSAPARVNDDGGNNSQFLPWMSVDQSTGTLVVAWYDARNDVNNQKVEVFMAVSEDGGQTFDTNETVSDASSDQSTANANRTLNNYLEYIGVACQDGTAYFVWSDNSADPADLDYYTDQVSLQSTPQNQAPVAAAGTDQTVNVGDLVTLDGSDSFDPDDGPNALSYSWTQTAGTNVTLTGATTASPAFTPSQSGSYTFQLTVNDGALGSAADTVTINVLPPNQPPIANAGTDQNVTIGALVTLNGTGSSDPDNGPGPLSYAWAQIGGPAISLVAANTASPTFTPTQQGTYTFQLVVNDGAADSSPDSVTIVVSSPGGGGEVIAAVHNLISHVRELGLAKGVETSLTSKLQAALAALNRGNTNAATGRMRAFVNEVTAQKGKKISAGQAIELNSLARQILAKL